MHEVHPYRRAHPHSRLLTIEAVLFVAFVVFLFLLLGSTTNAEPGAVLLGFLPSLLFGVAMILLVQTDHFQPTYNWMVLVGLLVLASVAFTMLPAGQGIDVATLVALNAILMALGLAIMHSSYVHEQPIVTHHAPVVHHEEKVVHYVHHQEPPQEISDVIQSIEDKVKALNFVIGRVYSVYHGGTERMRNKIRIDKAWYDDFNQIPEADLEKRRHEAIVLLQKIKERLELLQRSEREVFGDDHAQLKNIEHEASGGERVLSVLIRNDKDPVQQYYDGAHQFCSDALKMLKSHA